MSAPTYSDFESLLAAELTYLRRLALTMAGGDDDLADELFQQTAVSAWRYWERLEKKTSLRGWLTVILRNHYATYLADLRRRSQVHADDFHAIGVSDTTGAGIDLESLKARINRAITRLSPLRRELIARHCIDGISYEELAQRHGVPVGTIRSNLNRARASLRKLIGEEFYKVASESSEPNMIVCARESDSAGE